ncbi:hypothetical protein [Phenylobacterium sp.]|uniref:hypothetical protein n=1 Tax=Phenylobacterium sp. TaxID=1871053 RepID=UPI00286D7083|nr:hypothetical protein [Phenylobacterium sp.]
MVKRILWSWLKYALAFEGVVLGGFAYVAFRNHTVFYRDAEAFEDFLVYSVVVVGAAAILAVAGVLSGEEG